MDNNTIKEMFKVHSLARRTTVNGNYSSNNHAGTPEQRQGEGNELRATETYKKALPIMLVFVQQQC